MSSQTKNKLLIIMMRANQPMQLTGLSIITMSIDTLFKVYKFSNFYSLKAGDYYVSLT